MKYKIFMTIHSIALAYFAFGSLLIPNLFWENIYGMTFGEAGIWLARIIGLVVLGNLAMSLAARTQNNNPGRLAILTAFSGEWFLFSLISFWGQLSGVYGVLNWSNIVVALIFSLLLFLYRNKNLDE